jgi:hypothetical protein
MVLWLDMGLRFCKCPMVLWLDMGLLLFLPHGALVRDVYLPHGALVRDGSALLKVSHNASVIVSLARASDVYTLLCPNYTGLRPSLN